MMGKLIMPNIKLKFISDGNRGERFSPKIRIPFFIHGVVISPVDYDTGRV
jgi:hypothetical protein